MNGVRAGAAGRSVGRVAVAGAAAALILLPVCAAAATVLPSYQQVKDAYRASNVQILDRNGQLVERVRTDFLARKDDWVDLDAISPALQRAVILSEDQRFYSHSGVDWQGVLGAAWSNIFEQQHRGASTLTMQLVGFIDPANRRNGARRTLMQKLDQAMQARSLEHQWTKPQILEAYLNLVPFRGELVGVGALSRVMFQKHASGLDAREGALAAALLPGPNAPRAVITKRTCRLLERLDATQECDGLSDFIYLRLHSTASPRADSGSLAPHFARWVLGRTPHDPGQGVDTSMDAAVQAYAIASVDRHLRSLHRANVRDAAVVVLDNVTGEVLAYVGSSSDLSSAQHVDHARALRQAGSTLKPFLYAQAIEQQRLTTVSLLHDSPLNVPTGNGLYIPQNYDKRFAGWVSVRTALASSLNIPAVRTLVMVTPDAFQRRLVRLGLPLDHGGDFYGYSLALGSADITLLSLTNAYRALANLGWYSPVRTTADPMAPDGDQPVMVVDTDPGDSVMAAGAAWIVGDILSDRHARARTFGLDSPLTTPFWTAVKTGTSKDMRDNWCIGWSQRYTVGVWAGNTHGASMRDVSGVSGAGPIWHDVMSYLHRNQTSVQPAMPEGVMPATVVFEQDIEPARTDVFLGDTALRMVRLTANHMDAGNGTARIIKPAAGTILALDPDIPPEKQRTWLRASNLASQDAQHVSWRIGAATLGRGSELPWMPRPGHHQIELIGDGGRVLDSVTIEVRNAWTARPLR